MTRRPHGRASERISAEPEPQAEEVRYDSLGRRINPKQTEALKPTQFQPGQSGNPSGSFRSRPFTAAIMTVCEMKTREVMKISGDDPFPIAAAKSMGRQVIKGKVPAFTEMADRGEGKPGTRMQYENVPGTTFAVDQKVSGEVKVEISHEKLIAGIREIYGLSGHTYVRRSFVAVPVSEGLDQRRLPPKDSDKGS